MYLTHMRAEQIGESVARRLPVLIAAGVIEYHGPHLPVGTDLLITQSICEEVERRCPCVVAPPLPFGPTMNWAGGPPDGEIDFAPEPFFQYVKEMFRGLLKLGYSRIYVIHHHAGPDGLQRSCLKRAAGEVIRDIAADWSAGWGRQPMEALPTPGIFQLIQIRGLDDFSRYAENTTERMPIGHAGKGETQLMMAAAPQTVRMKALEAEPPSCRPPWLQDAEEADPQEGRAWLEFCIQGWVREMSAQRPPDESLCKQ